MFKNLYDNFAHWFHEGRGTVYFYSDPHFNDPEMVHLRKNYIGDEEQIKRINSKIGKYDTLVVLGDVGDIEWVRKIRGYKVLVMGNHDMGATKYKRKVIKEGFNGFLYSKEEVYQYMLKYFPHFNISITFDGEDWIATADNGLFDEVYEGALMIAPNIILSHEPVNFPFAVNIHGHDHSNWYPGGINMCAEHIDYTPVPLKTLVEKGMLKAPDIHRETIDKAIDRKAKRK
jgi:calcineurin-like phosphoesterase family protein